MLSLLIFPSSTSVIQQAGEWANPWLAEFWPLIGIGFGSFCFGLLVPWLSNLIIGGLTGAFGPNRLDPAGKQMVKWSRQHPNEPIVYTDFYKK